MNSADEYQKISNSLFFWQVYNPSVKADLSSCAVRLNSGLVFIDPVPLENSALVELAALGTPCAVVLTNGNHERAAGLYREQFGIPVYAPTDAKAELSADHWISDNEFLFGSLRVVAIPGFGLGEVALHFSEGEGAMVIGDAIINLGTHEFALLPEKYCIEQKTGRKSLEKLLHYDFQTMTFAHGTPIVRGAKARLEKLL